MCGITGFLDITSPSEDIFRKNLQSMQKVLYHRGPDDFGIWTDPSHGIGLGHRRLAIIDLSPTGHQPMISSSGRFVIVYNGEVYNFRDLRRELDKAGHVFSGSSDTEVLLAGFEEWGIETTLKKCVGMFALAVWDAAHKTLILGRDRMGEKPLYYGRMGKTFLFGSELKSLKAHPGWQGEIDRNALGLFLKFNYIPTPHTIYKNIYKLPPGTTLSISAAHAEQPVEPKPFWSLRDTALAGSIRSVAGPGEQAVRHLEELLLQSVQGQMIADVPLGAFLSGGIDSSIVVALMQAQSTHKVRTFTIGFDVPDYNEAEQARAVAEHLGTEHTELYASPKQALEVVEHLPMTYDEPFADASQIPTYLVSKLTKEHVTVSLSGDGGDELFGGYNRYYWADSLYRKMRLLPSSFRTLAARAIKILPPSRWDQLFNLLKSGLPERARQRLPGEKMYKIAAMLPSRTELETYDSLVSFWNHPREIVMGSGECVSELYENGVYDTLNSYIQKMQYLDQSSYLPDDILVKVDRAGMAVSLESRTPFLDHRVVEFAWTLPDRLKIRKGRGKWILREVLKKYVPEYLFDRPKTGFAVPIDAWLRGPLKPWAERLIDPVRLRREGYLNPGPVSKRWREHQSGKHNWQYHLWGVLMFQSWLEAGRSF